MKRHYIIQAQLCKSGTPFRFSLHENKYVQLAFKPEVMKYFYRLVQCEDAGRTERSQFIYLCFQGMFFAAPISSSTLRVSLAFQA